MASWWKTTSATNFTRGLSSLTGQFSNNLKDILTEATEETFDPATELERARQRIDDLEFRKQALTDECVGLKNQCDELIMQKQALEIKSDMLLAESRRTIDTKDNELKRLRETANAMSWNSSNDPSNTWTDILEDDQPEISEYLKYQKIIRELKDENLHLRDETANLRKSSKSQQTGKVQHRREDEIIQIQESFAEQMSKSRQEYEEKLSQLQQRIKQLEYSSQMNQADELRHTMEVQKDVDDVDKDLLSQELEQANNKLNWYNEKFKEYVDLEKNFDLLTLKNQQLEDDLKQLKLDEEKRKDSCENNEELIGQLYKTIDELKSDKEQEKQPNIDEDSTRCLMEERERCDALVHDNETICSLLEETRSQKVHIETQFKIQQQTLNERQVQIENFHDRLQEQEQQIEFLQNEIVQQQQIIQNQESVKNCADDQVQLKDRTIDEQRNQLELFKEQIEKVNEEKSSIIAQLNKFRQTHDEQSKENEENRLREIYLREMLERQLADLNEELQTFDNDKNDLQQQIEQLKEQLILKDRQIRNFENAGITPGSPSVLSSSPDTRARSPSPDTFEHVLELETQILRHEQQIRDLNSVYDRFVTLLPIEFESTDHQQISLADRFVNLFEQWSTYVDTLSITQQELDSVKQLLIEKQDDLEKLQTDLELTTSRLVEFQQSSSRNATSIIVDKIEENEDEIERILELHPFPQRAPSRQSLISSTPGEKQQLIAQNELLSSLLAEKDRELIALQQAEKTREELIKTLDTLTANLKQMELDKEVKQVELNDMRNVLDEKLRENSSLKKEKMYFIEKLSQFERDRQEQQSIIQVLPKQPIQDDEKLSSTIVTNTIEQQKNNGEVSNDEKYDKLRNEYEQLLDFSKKQHDDSLSYYNEYTRILSLFNDLNTKYSQIQVDYESLQSLIQQKNEAYLQCQNELSNYQNLFYHEKKKSEEFELLRSKLTERDTKLQQYIDNETKLLLKQSEFERQLKLYEQNLFELKSNEQLLTEQLQQNNTEQFHFELRCVTQERDLAFIEKRQLEQEFESSRQKILQNEDRERKLNNEIERLRTHLIQMEETYTNDLITAEDREKSLRNQVALLQDSNQAQNELIQQLNTSGEQSKQTLATELGTLKYEHGKLEATNNRLNEQLQYQMKCSQNLQNVLEQFKREREQHINEHLRQYQDTIRDQTAIVTRLTHENNEIRQRLFEYDEALAAARRLNDQLEKKDTLLKSLRHEIHEAERKIQQYEQNLRDLQSTSGTRVEKQLVKNILLSYFHTPVDKRQEVIPLLGALVGFTQEEYRKAIDATSNSNNQRGAGWLSGWLGGNQPASGTSSARTRTQSETPVYDPNKSFTELLIQYVDQQSTTTNQYPTAKFNTDEYLQRYDHGMSTGNSQLLRKPSLSASNNPFVNSTHLTLNRPASAIGFPSPSQLNDGSTLNPPSLPVSTSTTESSSTILKDLLKS